MARYQPSSLEQSLIAVNSAHEMAWSYLGNGLEYRLNVGAPIDGSIPDLSFEDAQRRTRLGEQIIALLDAVDDERLPHEFALTSKLLRYYATAWSKDAQRYWLACDLGCNLFYGTFAQTSYTGGLLFGLVNPALAAFRFDKDGDGDRYLLLLADITRLLRQMHARTAGQAERGIRIHQPQLPAVRKLLAGLRSGAALAYPLAVERLSALADAEAIAAESRRRVEQQLLPAFDALIAQLDDGYERQAPADVGMDKLPGGRAVYEDWVRMHTTLDLDPAQVHAAGHARMARIEAEMAQVRSQLGFAGSAAEFGVYLRQQPGAVAKNADDIGARMRKHKDRVEQRFDEFFAQRSQFDYDLERLSQELEGGLTWGYYQGPVGKDGRGLYYYNGSKLDSQAVIGAASLVYHELVPGHHLHLTLQVNNENLPPVRRNAYVNAFNEGWAEYAATLTGEMGLYDDPFDRYGRLAMDAFLTSRLVVDSGMNALGWTWEQAKDYMRTHTLCADGEIDSETLRYSCAIPAQALAYKLGDEEILRMREKLRTHLKDGFSYRDFHGAVLDAGGLPLPVLEWHLDKVFGVPATS